MDLCLSSSSNRHQVQPGEVQFHDAKTPNTDKSLSDGYIRREEVYAGLQHAFESHDAVTEAGCKSSSFLMYHVQTLAIPNRRPGIDNIFV